MKKKLTKKMSLIHVKPGEYLRAGSDGSAVLKVSEPTHGIVISELPAPTVSLANNEKSSFLTVLVNGHLVNVWKDSEAD